MTSSTELLRRMLDERGVEYDKAATINGGTVATFWYDRDGHPCSAIEGADDIPDGEVCVQVYLTPEQAIAATLGTRTLTAELRELVRDVALLAECSGSKVLDMQMQAKNTDHRTIDERMRELGI